MVPEWFDPIANTSLATGLIGFICWSIHRLAKFLGPKVAAFFESHAELVAGLKETGQTHAACLERLVDMGDHTVQSVAQLHTKADQLGQSVDGIKIDLNHVKGRVAKHDEILGQRIERTPYVHSSDTQEVTP